MMEKRGLRPMALSSIGPIAVAAIAFLTGCSDTGSPSAPRIEAAQRVRNTGLVHDVLRLPTLGPPASSLVPMAAAPFKLAVSDFGTDAVEVLDTSFHLASTITKGIDTADGIFYDTGGNLYVANSTGGKVTEYNKNQKLVFTYSSGLTDVVDVTADRQGNVYAVDFGDGNPSVVVEYPKRSRVPSASCATDLANDGIVVDSTGNVFVSGFDATHAGRLLEYKHGLAGCHGTMLAPVLQTGGGLAMDKQRNLLACDQDAGVDVIPPPYATIASTIPSLCFHQTLNKLETRIFIAEPNTNDVLVDRYPSGAHVATLGADNGLTEPAGVAAFP